MPFEPKGAPAAARGLLRDALATLEAATDQILDAEYSGPAGDFFDLENVLFYNVGPASFRRTTRSGLSARRCYAAPPSAPSRAGYGHHHRYALRRRPARPADVPTLAFTPPTLNSRLKAADVWWAASGTPALGVAPVRERYGLTVEIPQAATYVAAILKPLLDGIICALHQGSAIDPEAVARLARRSGWAPAEVARRLSNPSCPALPPRTVLRPYRNFVKWDPADDQCDEFTVVTDTARRACSVWLRPA